MINAHALLEDLQELRSLPAKDSSSTNSAAPTSAAVTWLEGRMRDLPLGERHTDAAGNRWFTLHGGTERTVLLGCHPTAWADGDLDACLGLATAVETLKALALRTGNRPPATLSLVSWAGNAPTEVDATTPELGKVAAYLELHMEHGSVLEEAGAALGVATSVRFPLGPMQTDSSRSGSAETITFHPRLVAMCDEAIRELTGTTAALPTAEVEDVALVARTGIPAGILLVQALHTQAGQMPKDDDRLHLQQAAEAFGRWAEATMHWVAGEGVDLWAREQRIPHGEGV